MNTREQLIKARLGLLQLAEELDNVKLACKRAGISRSHFYEIKEAFEIKVEVTPTLVVNGKKLQATNQFLSAVEEERKKLAAAKK